MKTTLKNDLYDGERIALFQDEIAPKPPKSTISGKTPRNTGNAESSNTALYIALAGLIILIGIMIYKNMIENE